MKPIKMLIGFCVLIVVLGVFRLVRNSWVYDQRTHLVFSDYATYKKLPSYGTMLNQFWIWDINEFVKLEEEKKNGRNN